MSIAEVAAASPPDGVKLALPLISGLKANLDMSSFGVPFC
jgi:hypothetical protein